MWCDYTRWPPAAFFCNFSSTLEFETYRTTICARLVRIAGYGASLCYTIKHLRDETLVEQVSGIGTDLEAIIQRQSQRCIHQIDFAPEKRFGCRPESWQAVRDVHIALMAIVHTADQQVATRSELVRVGCRRSN